MFLPKYYTDSHSGALVCETTLKQLDPVAVIDCIVEKEIDGNIIKEPFHEEVFDFRTFPFKEVFASAPVLSKKGKNRDNIKYLDLVATFDIETTTIEDNDPPYSFMYQWQFCIESVVFMGRTWKEFQELISIIKRELGLYIKGSEEEQTGRAIVCYVCNLPFEFQFMRYYLPELISPLFTDKYRPLVVPTAAGIVFRCAARLFNKTLEKITKGFPHEKLVGDLDYSIIRTPKTKLSNIELAYCFNDVKGLAEAIRDRLNHDKHYNIANIPLTSTGYVRKDCQRAVNSNPENRKIFLKTKLTAPVYTLCRDAFRGGNTHANAIYTGEHLHQVASQDIASSYPAQILLRTFPVGRWKKIPPEEVLRYFSDLIKTHCILMRVVFFNIKYIRPDNVSPLSVSKCIIDRSGQWKEDNGRIYSATKLETCLTEVDLFTILKSYKYDSVKILEAYASPRGMLSEELRSVCFEYYQRKTLLKHSTDPDDIYNYNRAKELLNSTYGMMVQRLDRTDFRLVNNQYVPTYKPLQDQIDSFYASRSSFLNYSHGIYVTAWSRYLLDSALQIVAGDFVYCDTDSVKYLNPQKYEQAFTDLNNQLKKLSEKHHAVAYDINKKPVYIGTFDFEGIYTDFCTLGSKKYLYSHDNCKTIHATISGVNKEVGQHFFTSHGFEAFKDGQVLADSGKLTAYYNDEPPHTITIQGTKIETASNVALINSRYTINVRGEYQEFINYLRRSVEQIYLQ